MPRNVVLLASFLILLVPMAGYSELSSEYYRNPKEVANWMLTIVGSPAATPVELKDVLDTFAEYGRNTRRPRIPGDEQIFQKLLSHRNLERTPAVRAALESVFVVSSGYNVTYASLLPTEVIREFYRKIQKRLPKRQPGSDACQGKLAKARAELAHLHERISHLDPSISGVAEIKKSIRTIEKTFDTSAGSVTRAE